MAVRIERGRRVGQPKVLFPHAAAYRDWDVSPDGRHFFVVDRGAPTQINVISNWFEELKRLVPTGGK